MSTLSASLKKWEKDRGKKEGESMKSVLNDFANDTDADLAAYVQMYRTRIADRTDEIEEMVRGPIDEVVRDAIARLKEEQEEERERLEQIKDEQKRRARERQRDGVEC